MTRDDAECVRLSLDGRPDAFRELVERYERPLVSYLSGALGNREQALEAAQEAFVRSYARLATLQKPGSYFAWLLSIAGRVVKEERRRRRRFVAAAEHLARARRDDAAQPDYELEKAVADLPERYRQAVLLRYYGGLSCAETAERLSLNVAVVTKRLSRAYAMLRKSLASKGARSGEALR